MKLSNERKGTPAVGCSALLGHAVEVKIGDKIVWQRRHENGSSGGITARSKPLLESVVPILCDAIMQAQGELSLLLDDGNRISDGRFITLSDIKRDIPVTRMGWDKKRGKTPVKTSAIGATLAALETLKLGVGSQHDIALGVTGDTNGVPVIQILSCVDELHNVVCVVWSNDSSSATATTNAAKAGQTQKDENAK